MRYCAASPYGLSVSFGIAKVQAEKLEDFENYLQICIFPLKFIVIRTNLLKWQHV